MLLVPSTGFVIVFNLIKVLGNLNTINNHIKRC